MVNDGHWWWDGQVIAAEGEQKASRALREAAEVIAESPSALQLRCWVSPWWSWLWWYFAMIYKTGWLHKKLSSYNWERLWPMIWRFWLLVKLSEVIILIIVFSSHTMLCFNFRYLQTLSTISAEHNSTIVFPMPINIMEHFIRWRSTLSDISSDEYQHCRAFHPVKINIVEHFIRWRSTLSNISSDEYRHCRTFHPMKINIVERFMQ